MQPVTIKNNKFINTLYILQWCLFLVFILSLTIGWKVNGYYLVFSALALAAMFYLHRRLQSNNIELIKMTNKGMSLSVFDTVHNKSNINDVTVDACWQLPSILFLKLKIINQSKYLHLMFFRSQLTGNQFISLLSQTIKPDSKVVLK